MKTSTSTKRAPPRQIRAKHRQLVQPPTAATLPPGVTKPKKPVGHPDGRDAVFNAHKVVSAQWKEWNGNARRAFNNLFSFMMRNPGLFYYPMSKQLPMHEWNTVAHNAAWTAADAVMGIYSGDEMGTHGNATYIEPAAVRKARAKATADKAKSVKAKAGRVASRSTKK